jgi:tungstate transport system substrate-binding protein
MTPSVFSTIYQSFRPIAQHLIAQAATVFVVSVAATGAVHAQNIVMASTTSTEQSGLFSYLLPEFKRAMGIDVKVVALGTGQAIDMGRRGDADVLFVHDQIAEEKFVAEGYSTKRLAVQRLCPDWPQG